MSSSSCGNNIYPHWKAKQTASMAHGDTSARLSYVAAALTVQNTMVMMFHTRRIMHCTCIVTLWRVSVTTVAMETQQYFPSYCCWRTCTCLQYKRVQCCQENAIMSSLCTVVDLQNISLLLTIMSIIYYQCAPVFLPELRGMQIAPFLLRITLSSVACTAVPYFPILSHKRHRFGETYCT